MLLNTEYPLNITNVSAWLEDENYFPIAKSALDVRSVMMLCSEDSKTSTRTCVQEGDAVVLYVGYNQVHYIAAVERERIFNSRAGNFYHSGIIGAPYGSKVYLTALVCWVSRKQLSCLFAPGVRP